MIQLSLNENPFGPSPLALEAMKTARAASHLYPDDDSKQLRESLASFYKVRSEEVLLTAGCTAALEIIARAVLSPGLNAVTSQQSFIEYPILTKMIGAKLIEVPLRNHGFDLDAVAEAINPDTRLIFLANPNNPTGSLFDVEETDRFLDKVPENIVVALDEAYYEFGEYFAKSRGIRYSRSLEYLRERQNVVVLRTFSKVHGLAGLRVGYCLGPPALLQRISAMRLTFSVSSMAQAAALAAMKDATHIQRTLRNNAEQAHWLAEQMAALGHPVTPPWANFIYCDLGQDAGPVAELLHAEGITIRALGPWGAPTALRISIGTLEQNQAFIAAFAKAMKR